MKRQLLAFLLIFCLVLPTFVACEQGQQGEQGIQGEPGPQGEQGIQGEKGDPGEKGEPGEKGNGIESISTEKIDGVTTVTIKFTDPELEDVVFTINDGEDGEKGEQGIQGEKGEQGETGEKGDKGDQGETGAKGDQGVGIASAAIVDGSLILTLTDGTRINAGSVIPDDYSPSTPTYPKPDDDWHETEGTTNTNSGSTSSGTQTTERFDYSGNDMTKYISIDASAYKNFTVTLSKTLMPGKEGVQAYIAMLCDNYKSSTGNKITDRAVAEGDTVMIYYEGYLNGETFSGGSNMDDESPYALVIGSGSFIPGFEEALIGIIPSETSRDNLVDLNLTFPESYYSDLAGKDVVFKVYIEYIDEMAPAEYTEEFITETLQYTTTDTDIKASFEKYIEEEIIPSVRKNELLNAIWDHLFEAAVVTKYPESEVAYYYEQYIAEYEYYREYFAYLGQSFNTLDEFVVAYLGLTDGEDWKTVTTDNAKIDVSQNLIFHYIAQVENVTITDADYEASVQYYIDYYASLGQTLTKADVETYFGERMIKEQSLFDKVNDLLAEYCSVVYED